MEPMPGRLRPVEAVRCLGCGASYTKPTGRGTLSANPGCPECGYVGWLHSRDWLGPDRVNGAELRGRFAADPQPRPRR